MIELWTTLDNRQLLIMGNHLKSRVGVVGRGPILDAHVGLGTTAMSGFVPAAEMLQPNQIAAFKC